MTKSVFAQFRYKCSSCDQLHEGLPDLTYWAPDAYIDLSEDDRQARALLNDDHCIVDGTDYFVRCIIEIPILGFDESLGLGVWVQFDWRAFKTCWEYAGSEGLPDEPAALPGRLANDIEGYDDTLGLACMVMLQDDDMRPLVITGDGSAEKTAATGAAAHLLTREQRDGITPERAIEQARRAVPLVTVVGPV